MKIVVGSKNPIKINAVTELIQDYEFLSGAEVLSENASSEITNQPITLDETIQGAMNRARNAFKNCDLSIGLESGLVKVPNTKSGYMDTTACAIFDGKVYHLGLSSGFEYPKRVIDLVFKEKLEIDEAVHKLGITENKRVGYSSGMIGLLSKGRLDRKAYTKQALTTALLHLDNKELYRTGD